MSFLNSEQVKYLQEIKDSGGRHASNILAKRNDSKIGNFIDQYINFSNVVGGLTGNVAGAQGASSVPNERCKRLKRAIKALNTYKDYVDEHNAYTAQSKFAPTIIEEFLCRILKGEFGNGVLQYGSVSAYSSLYFSYSDKASFKDGVEIKLNVKDQDVGIYKDEVLTSSTGRQHEISIPIVCIECKTYLDKTMYEGSVATATRIKTGNPYCLFFIVTETYDVSKDVDIETTDIDNIYVLRKQRRRSSAPQRNPIYADVVEHLLVAIEARLNATRMTVDERIRSLGYIRQK